MHNGLIRECIEIHITKTKTCNDMTHALIGSQWMKCFKWKKMKEKGIIWSWSKINRETKSIFSRSTEDVQEGTIKLLGWIFN